MGIILRKLRALVLFTIISIVSITSTSAQNSYSGYYKDIFMDSGIVLTSLSDLPAARALNLSIDAMIFNRKTDSTVVTMLDTLMQTALVVGSPMDENGVLLYPDGAPRFRMIYMNGGRASGHGRSLTPEGRQRMRDFVENGGSYVGSCAGAYLTSKHYYKDSLKMYQTYLGFWPGTMSPTGLRQSWTDVTIEKESPLLRYYDFGGDMQVDSVRHNGGGYANVDYFWPEATEILARYKTEGRGLKRDIHNKPVIWAYKESDATGRIVACGSHPETVEYGERLDLMCAMIRYALEGNGTPRLKAELSFGEPRVMNRRTSDNDPAHTCIGDRQYHHFSIDVPEGKETMTITVLPQKGWEHFDLYLFVNKGNFAFSGDSKYTDMRVGVSKQIVIPAPKAGRYFISVFCATTVDTIDTKYGQQYVGRTDVLNGVPYTIAVE